MTYIARSASDKTTDWPFWMVMGPDNINQTCRLVAQYTGNDVSHLLPFVGKEFALELAEWANNGFIKTGEEHGNGS